MSGMYDEAAAKVKADHVASPFWRITGWSWACSCGSEGKGVGTRTEAGARAAMERHLRAEKRRLLTGKPKRRPKFVVGDRATHKSGTLDSREVGEVSEDGTMIRLQFFSSLSDWYPAKNYTCRRMS